MKLSDFQKTIQCQFDCKLKNTVKGVVWNYSRELKRRRDREISFCELPEIVVEKLSAWDEYETDYTVFNICGTDIRILDDELAEALQKLSEKKRNTLLMYYFLELPERKIADMQNITQSGVFRRRHQALDAMRKILKEK